MTLSLFINSRMKFFEAQKRAAFAAKLFTNAGLDFDALVEANNPDALKAALSATDTLFATAGLDRAALVAAGPDALKLHIDGLTNDEAMAEALLENEKLDVELALVKGRFEKLSADFGAIKTIATTIGLTDSFEASQVSAAFADHVAKATAVALAKTGHPPVSVVAVDDMKPSATVQSDAVLLDQYLKLIEASNGESATAADHKARTDFYVQHAEAIQRANRARQRG